MNQKKHTAEKLNEVECLSSTALFVKKFLEDMPRFTPLSITESIFTTFSSFQSNISWVPNIIF